MFLIFFVQSLMLASSIIRFIWNSSSSYNNLIDDSHVLAKAMKGKSNLTSGSENESTPSGVSWYFQITVSFRYYYTTNEIMYSTYSIVPQPIFNVPLFNNSWILVPTLMWWVRKPLLGKGWNWCAHALEVNLVNVIYRLKPFFLLIYCMKGF